MANVAGLDRLKSQLLTSGLQQKDQPLYQVINQLIEFVRQSINENQAAIDAITGGGALPTQSFVTTENELAGLPFSRRIVAGAGIGFNNDGQRLVISGAVPWGFDGEDGEPGFPGVIGPRGLTGPIGPPTGMLPSPDCDYDIETPLPIGNSFFPSFGVWTLVAYNAANFTASGAMTWGVGAADQVDYSYMIINNTMFVLWRIDNSTIGGVVDFALRLAIPAGKVAAALTAGTMVYLNGGTYNTGWSQVAGAGTFIEMYRSPLANWVLGVDNVSCYGHIVFPIR